MIGPQHVVVIKLRKRQKLSRLVPRLVDGRARKDMNLSS